MNKSQHSTDVKKILLMLEEVKDLCSKQEAEIVELKKELKNFKKENLSLKEKLSNLQHRKNSNNSSMSPSSDITKAKRTVSLRKPSGKKPGGQVGRKGSTLKMIESADLIENHYPQICENCGSGLSDITGNFCGRRQVIDLPIIRQIVTEHRVYTKQCTCGHCTKSTYPKGVVISNFKVPKIRN